MNKRAMVLWEVLTGVILLLFGIIGWWILSSVSIDPLTSGQINLFVALIIFGAVFMVIGLSTQ